jgi:hypothetical protein
MKLETTSSVQYRQQTPHTYSTEDNCCNIAITQAMHTLSHGSDCKTRLLQFQRLQILPEIRAQVVALERKFHRRLQEAQLVAGIVSLAFEGVTVNLFLLE